MKNNWSNTEAKKYISKYKKLGHSRDMALRVYTTRLLGRNSELVLHGGGNTSVKTTVKDLDGKKYDVFLTSIRRISCCIQYNKYFDNSNCSENS